MTLLQMYKVMGGFPLGGSGDGLIMLVSTTVANDVITSPDGINWTTRATPALSGDSNVIYSHLRDEFLITTASATNFRCYNSENAGVSWSDNLSPGGFANMGANRGLFWVEDFELYVLGSEGTDSIWTSPTGVTWTQRTTPSSATISMFAYSPTLGRLLAMSSSSDISFYSDDGGATWTDGGAPGTSLSIGLVWAPSLGKFYSINSNQRFIHSTDGTSWTVGTSPTAGTPRSVVWSEALDLFCVTTDDTDVATSPDGVTWTNRTANKTNLRDLVWNAPLGIFFGTQIHSSSDDSGDWSSDGTNWTAAVYPVEAGNYRYSASAVRQFPVYENSNN